MVDDYPVVTFHNRTPPWNNIELLTFMNDMKRTFRKAPTADEPIFEPAVDGIPGGTRVGETGQLLSKYSSILHRFVAIIWGMGLLERTSYYQLGPPARPPIPLSSVDEDDIYWRRYAERHELWSKCPLLGPDIDDHFVQRWQIARMSIGIAGSRDRPLGLNVQIHMVGHVDNPDEVALGARFTLITAAWSLAASFWQSSSRFGMALFNTSFARLLIVDEGGTTVLVIEQADDIEMEHDAETRHLAGTCSLAHNYFPRVDSDIDRDEFDLLWATFVRGYDIIVPLRHEARRERQRLLAESQSSGTDRIVADEDDGWGDEDDDEDEDDDGDEDEDMNGVDDSHDDGGNSDETASTATVDDDNNDYSGDTPQSDVSTHLSNSSCFFFDLDENRYDDIPHLLISLARMFPRYRAVSPRQMSGLIEREFPTTST